MDHLAIIMAREPRSIPQRWRLGVNRAPHGAMTTCPNSYQKLDPALDNEGRNPLGPLLVPSGLSLILMTGWLQVAQKVPQIRHLQTQGHQGETWWTLT